MSYKLKVLLFTLCLFTTFLCAHSAQNQIVNTSVRKISENTVNFTFYSQGENLEKPIVKSKGNNEYTILLPNLADNSSRSVNISGTDGIVTSADVKTINEGAVTYTKINVKTSKPVTINAETRRTTQSASDLSKVNSIVSKVGLINDDIQNSKNVVSSSSQPVNSQPVTLKASSVKDIIRQNSASVPKKNAIQEAVAVNSVSAHAPNVKKLDKTSNSKQKDENIKNIKPVSNIEKSLPSKSQTVSKSVKAQENKSDEDLSNIALSSIAIVDDDVSINANPPKAIVAEDFDENKFANKSKFSLLDSLKGILFAPLTTIILLSCALIAFFAFLFNKLTSNLSLSKNINDSLVEKINDAFNKPVQKDFSGIVNDEKLSWQEKYRAFNEFSKKPDKKENKTIDDNYVFELSSDKEPKAHNGKTLDKNNPFRFVGFSGAATKSSVENTQSKAYNFKSFSTNSAPTQDVRERLENILQDDILPPSYAKTAASQKLNSNSGAENMRIIFNSSIDIDKEFFIVSENDEYSLVGRVKNKLIILKRFGKTAPEDLQVHRAQGNSFVVKAGSYKTEVDVSETDMNILAQV